VESSRFHVRIDGDGFVTASWLLPEKPHAVITLAHGAGTHLDHPLMRELAFALASEQLAILRFNFLYTEQKRKRPDVAAKTFPVIAAAVREASNRFPKLPLFMAGKSFGGRMSSQWVATTRPGNVNGLIFFGFPFHPSGKPGIERAAHLKVVALPMLFLQGSNDELATPALLEPVVQGLARAELLLLEGANHGLQVGKMIDYTAIGSAVKRFVETQ
jgi:predicted alpha/beta-hydrolase family hydrolase